MELCKAFLILTLAVLLLSLIPTVEASVLVRVVVGVERNTFDRVRGVLERYGSIHSELPEIGAVALEVPQHTLKHIERIPGVKYVELDAEIHALGEVQWNIEMVNATRVWSEYSGLYSDAAYGYHGTVEVAVVDTGVDYSHRDLQGAVIWCVVSLRNTKTFYRGFNLKSCSDSNGHGTHVAGIIAARVNGFGVAGVAPRVRLYAVKVLSPSGSGYVSDVARGVIEATKGPDSRPGTPDDADVISMSLGGSDTTTLRSAIMYAYNYSVTLVAAAGNEGAPQPSCPACYSEVIAVGAVDQNHGVPAWSNRNPDLTAPGVGILSTWPKNGYVYASGTSMACPHVSGVVAVIQALRAAANKPKLTPQQVSRTLTETAKDLGIKGHDETYGYGLLDAYGAAIYALQLE
ncbi:MAG: S8 family peptidase [Ignisphaera sp.]|nr:S8 family peptidase [Ignisphaera sp.]MDW8085607.1 S8 family peptidase [Ignisphaera sp.]